MGQVEPGGALVVEVGERAFFEVLRTLFVFGDDARVADGADSVADAPRAIRGRGARRLHVAGSMYRPPGAGGGAGEFEDFGPGPFGRVEPVVAEPVEFLAAAAMASRFSPSSRMRVFWASVS